MFSFSFAFSNCNLNTRVITPKILFLKFNFVVILRWYSKERDPSGYPGTIAVKDGTILIRYSQIWHIECS